MAKKKSSDLKNLTSAELMKLDGEVRVSIAKAQMDMMSRKSKNTNVAKNLRIQLARIENFKRAKDLEVLSK